MNQLLNAFGVQQATSDASAPPPGFTAAEWKRLQRIAKNDPKVADLMKRYSDNGGKNPDDVWRRVMPTDTSQLLKQLSYNAGEMGMPGGYVGAVQLPAYGETQPPVNNPDMSKYGQAPGLGEATFYQQSIKGGMTPLAAMSPLGVPQGWNPGGANDLQAQLKEYLEKIGKGGRAGGGAGGGTRGGGGGAGGKIDGNSALSAELSRQMKAGAGSGGMMFNFGSLFGIADRRDATRRKAKATAKTDSSSSTPAPTGTQPGGTTGTGVPIKRPYGY